MSEHDRRLRQEGLSWTPTDDGEVVVLDMRTARYLSLNSSGAVLWKRLAEGARHDELVSELVDRYGLESSRAVRDVEAFLDGLGERNLLED